MIREIYQGISTISISKPLTATLATIVLYRREAVKPAVMMSVEVPVEDQHHQKIMEINKSDQANMIKLTKI